MPGTKAGGIKVRAANLARDPDYYKKLGAIGGAKSKTGGFAAGEAGRERARYWGKHGGRKSRRAWTEADRQAHSVTMKQVRAELDKRKAADTA